MLRLSGVDETRVVPFEATRSNLLFFRSCTILMVLITAKMRDGAFGDEMIGIWGREEGGYEGFVLQV